MRAHVSGQNLLARPTKKNKSSDLRHFTGQLYAQSSLDHIDKSEANDEQTTKEVAEELACPGSSLKYASFPQKEENAHNVSITNNHKRPEKEEEQEELDTTRRGLVARQACAPHFETYSSGTFMGRRRPPRR